MASCASAVTTSSAATLPLQLQQPLLPPRTLRLFRCSLRTQAATLLCRSSSAQQAGLHGRVARHVFQLTDDHKRQRLSFAQGYERWTVDDWRRVIFADIKTFEGEGSHGQVWVRRPVGEAANPAYSVAH